MRYPVFFSPLFVFLAVVIATPVPAETTIYSWRDANGVLTYSNSPAELPGNAQVFVRAETPTPSGQPESPGNALTGTAPPQTPERPLYTATQGEFAAQLVKELGLGEPADAGQAADTLAGLRIAPALGQWLFDQPMTPELTTRLRRLTVAAADRGAITLTPEQALLAFDTTAALLNVDIPTPTDQDIVSYAPYPMTDMPPLVDFYQPPPLFSPYYVWVPFTGGFWWGDYFFSGYFVLNVAFFCDQHRDHYHDSHYRSASIDPNHISHHVRGHIADHRLGTTPGSRIAGNGQRNQLPGRQENHQGSQMNRSTGRSLQSDAPTHPQQPGVHASRSTADPRIAMATRPANSYRSSFNSPSSRSRSYQAPSLNARSFRSLPSRPTYRTTLPSTLNYHRAGGVAPSRPSFHGGSELTTRFFGHASIGMGGRGGAGVGHSAGGSVRPGASSHR